MTLRWIGLVYYHYLNIAWTRVRIVTDIYIYIYVWTQNSRYCLKSLLRKGLCLNHGNAENGNIENKPIRLRSD